MICTQTFCRFSLRIQKCLAIRFEILEDDVFFPYCNPIILGELPLGKCKVVNIIYNIEFEINNKNK